MEDRRSKGLCFNCDEKYVRGHRCKRLFYIESADEDDEDEGDNLQILPPCGGTGGQSVIQTLMTSCALGASLHLPRGDEVTDLVFP
jgi:hypothetical protein